MFLNNKTFIVLGAEGISEAPPEWLERASAQEMQEVCASQTPPLTDKFFIDKNLRPYFLVKVLDTAPEEIRARMHNKIRAVRLED